MCGQKLQVLTNVTCSENCCKSRGRRKGNERAEIRNTTLKHTHTHTLSSQRSRKGCLRKRGTRSRRCVHNNTQRHNNTDAESHSTSLIHRTEIRMSHAGCRGYIGRQEHPETQSNTRTYGTKKSSYVHAYIGRSGKWRKREQTQGENQKNVNHRERGGKKYVTIENGRGGPVAIP